MRGNNPSVELIMPSIYNVDPSGEVKSLRGAMVKGNTYGFMRKSSEL